MKQLNQEAYDRIQQVSNYPLDKEIKNAIDACMLCIQHRMNYLNGLHHAANDSKPDMKLFETPNGGYYYEDSI